VHITGVGSCTVTASQAGDTNYSPAPVVSRTFAIARASQTIAFAPLADKTYGDPDFAVSATASSGLPVSFGAGGNCVLSGSSVHITGVGSCTITASQAGDANYSPAPTAARTFSITNLPKCVVPNVVGMLLGKAVDRIARAHCRPGRVVRQPSSKARKNHVIAQNPKPGKTLKQGAKVNLTVGEGTAKRK
jgi:hypothetical protein